MTICKTSISLYLLAVLAALSINMAHAASVLSSSPAIQSLVLQLTAGTETKAHLLLDEGESIHRFNLSVAKLRLLKEADLVVAIGAGEPDFLHGEELAELRESDEGTVFLVDELPKDALIAGDCHDKNDNHDELHNITCADPHIWLSIDNARAIAKLLARLLSELDEANAGQYASNLAVANNNLDGLHASIMQTLGKRVKGLQVVVWHDAYRYFQKSFDLAPYSSVTSGDGHFGLSGKMLLQALETLEASDRPCLLFDSAFDKKQHEAAFDSVDNLTVAIADPIGSLGVTRASSYARLLSGIATAFASCS